MWTHHQLAQRFRWAVNVTEDGNILPPADVDEVPANQEPAEKRSAEENPENNDTQHEEERSLCAQNSSDTDVWENSEDSVQCGREALFDLYCLFVNLIIIIF